MIDQEGCHDINRVENTTNKTTIQQLEKKEGKKC